MASVIPLSQADWSKSVRRMKLSSSKSIAIAARSKPASTFTFKDFLLLRVLYVPHKTEDKLLNVPAINSEAVRLAEAAFNSNPTAWKSYIDSCKSPDPGQDLTASFFDLGIFALVRYYQSAASDQLVVDSDKFSSWKVFTPVAARTRARLKESKTRPETPSPLAEKYARREGISMDNITGMLDLFNLKDVKDPSNPIDTSEKEDIDVSDDEDDEDQTMNIPYEHLSPVSPGFVDLGDSQLKAIEDEQVVNTALLLFLNAITLFTGDLQTEWTLHRRRFVFKSTEGKKVYEARVDGYLRSRSTGEVKVIVEVKPFTRMGKQDAIRIQESAQMVSWIRSEPPVGWDMEAQDRTWSRLIVSQDRHEIYLSMATFDKDYLRYIHGLDSQVSFLEMEEFGPFITNVPEHMHALGVFIAAYCQEIS